MLYRLLASRKRRDVLEACCSGSSRPLSILTWPRPAGVDLSSCRRRPGRVRAGSVGDPRGVDRDRRASSGWQDARAELEQTLQVRDVCARSGASGRQDLEDERRGEDLLDPGRGYAEEAVLHAAVGGARRDPISLGDRVVLLSGLRDLARTDRSTSTRIGQRRDRPRLGSPGTR
jgi:hypothetical protein